MMAEVSFLFRTRASDAGKLVDLLADLASKLEGVSLLQARVDVNERGRVDVAYR